MARRGRGFEHYRRVGQRHTSTASRSPVPARRGHACRQPRRRGTRAADQPVIACLDASAYLQACGLGARADRRLWKFTRKNADEV